ncbi:hypothetical protein [Arsukibacterium sp. MJ3]|nr:hypothetical protein [Arsukibacterium sp. MJ3]
MSSSKHHVRLELRHYGNKAESYPSGQLVFKCQQHAVAAFFCYCMLA